MNIKVLVTVLAISTATHADDQRSIAERSMKSWRALECSVLAEGMSDQGEQERLFRLGYAEGIAFLEALEAGEVADEAIRAHALWPFSCVWVDRRTTSAWAAFLRVPSTRSTAGFTRVRPTRRSSS